MTDEEIEKALFENYDKNITDWLDCYGVYSYIKRLKEEKEKIRKQVAKEIIGELKGDMAIATFTFNPTLASELKTIWLRLQKEYGVEDE